MQKNNNLFWKNLINCLNVLKVWYRVIQIVINREDVQGYAAKTVFEALQAPACHENMVKVGGMYHNYLKILLLNGPKLCIEAEFLLTYTT